MNKLLAGLVGVVALWTVNSCQPKDPEPRLRNAIRITDQLYASYEVLNMDGQPGTRFREGENFQLSFKFRNVSDDTLYTFLSTTPLSRLFFIRDRQVFSVLKKGVGGRADQIMGRPVNSGFAEFFQPGGVVLLPKTTLTYQVPWQTQINERYLIPVYDPIPPFNSLGYVIRYYIRDGNEFKADRLPEGVYYSTFSLDLFGKRVPFRVDFTVK